MKQDRLSNWLNRFLCALKGKNIAPLIIDDIIIGAEPTTSQRLDELHAELIQKPKRKYVRKKKYNNKKRVHKINHKNT